MGLVIQAQINEIKRAVQAQPSSKGDLGGQQTQLFSQVTLILPSSQRNIDYYKIFYA
jgi:hypothetical protein